MSLLDAFIERGCLTVLTTHHSILKNYGYSRPACLNASMDFDKAAFRPTYRILMGVPGESRALEVASKNGLPAAIVSGASKYLAEERADVSELIKGLTEKHRELEDIEADRRKRLREAKEAQRKADLGSLRVRQKELELRERGVSDLRRLLDESRKTLENLVKEIREGELTPEKTQRRQGLPLGAGARGRARRRSVSRASGQEAALSGPEARFGDAEALPSRRGGGQRAGIRRPRKGPPASLASARASRSSSAPPASAAS